MIDEQNKILVNQWLKLDQKGRLFQQNRDTLDVGFFNLGQTCIKNRNCQRIAIVKKAKENTLKSSQKKELYDRKKLIEEGPK